MTVVRLPPYQFHGEVFTTLAQTVDYGVLMLGVSEIWKTTKGAGIRAAILDTGGIPNHPDLQGAYEDGADFTGSPRGWVDFQGHGGHCTGILGARDNDTGVVGIAPECRILAAKVLGDDGSGTGQSVANGIYWAISKKVDLISMSLGSSTSDPKIHSAINAALAAGIPVLAAAGNVGAQGVGFPAQYPGVISVGSIDRQKNISSFSSRGDRVDIVAPGDRITSTYKDGYVSLSGTSMACPAAAGVVALFLADAKQKGLPAPSPSRIIEALRSTATDLGAPGKDTSYGYGLITPDKLLSTLQPVPPPPPPVQKIGLTSEDFSAAGLVKLRGLFGTDIELTLRTR